MTDRVEVLTDGGSALYGSDAVAGVVNLVMRTDFEGIELFADTQGIEESGGTYENTFSGIWGTSFNEGATRLVISGEYFERDPVRLEDAQYFEEGRTISNGAVERSVSLGHWAQGSILPLSIFHLLSSKQ